MMKNRFWNLTACALLSLPFAACTDSATEDQDIADDLEMLNGGLSMADEEPMFGDAALFGEAGLVNDETPVDDQFSDDGEVRDIEESPTAAAYNAVIMWGKFPADLRAEEGHVWSGTMSVNRGAILVRRTIAFDRNDEILRRDSRLTFAFVSTTRPHRAGVVVTKLHRTPTSVEALTITSQPRSGEAIQFDVAALLRGRQVVDVDRQGNKMVAVAHQRRADECDSGFMRGRWHQVSDARGRLFGVVSNSEGEPLGHMKGVFGARRSGRNVFFGKYINRAGEFRGLFAGLYADGQFRGRWIHRAGDRGVLGGGYRADVGADETGDIAGHFLGRWAETSCNLSIEPGERPDADREPASSEADR